MFFKMFVPTEVTAHCDLPCGVYDPAQARIEAESIKAIIGKVAANDDPDFRTRALIIKEQRSEMVKHHLSRVIHAAWQVAVGSDLCGDEHLEKHVQPLNQ